MRELGANAARLVKIAKADNPLSPSSHKLQIATTNNEQQTMKIYIALLLLVSSLQVPTTIARLQGDRSLQYKSNGDPCSPSYSANYRECQSDICNANLERCDAVEQGSSGALCLEDSQCSSGYYCKRDANYCADFPQYSSDSEHSWKNDCGICASAVPTASPTSTPTTTPLLANGEDCTEDSECESGSCVYVTYVTEPELKIFNQCQDPTLKAVGQTCTEDDECSTGLCSIDTSGEYVCAECDAEISGILRGADNVFEKNYNVDEDGCYDGSDYFVSEEAWEGFETGNASGSMPIKNAWLETGGLTLVQDDFGLWRNDLLSWGEVDNINRISQGETSDHPRWYEWTFRNVKPGRYLVTAMDEDPNDYDIFGIGDSMCMNWCDRYGCMHHYRREILISQCRGAKVERADGIGFWENASN